MKENYYNPIYNRKAESFVIFFNIKNRDALIIKRNGDVKLDGIKEYSK